MAAFSYARSLAISLVVNFETDRASDHVVQRVFIHRHQIFIKNVFDKAVLKKVPSELVFLIISRIVCSIVAASCLVLPQTMDESMLMESQCSPELSILRIFSARFCESDVLRFIFCGRLIFKLRSCLNPNKITMSVLEMLRTLP